ncbi:MAG: pyruvate formate lyase family protein, partial [Armatimonadota bacterium]
TLDEADPQQMNRVDTLWSMIVACRAVIHLAHRHADRAEELAQQQDDPQTARELQELAEICRKVPAGPAGTFHEAVQSLWMTHLGIYLECENVAFSLGRMDQYLYPFYRADIEASRIDHDRALEIMQCLWIKFYENVEGRIGHVQTVTVGGVKPDGTDGTNDMTWLIQQVTRSLSNVGPSVASRLHSGTPREYIEYLLETMSLGRYMPQVYNDDQMVPAIASKGVPVEDAREYGLIGCHEPTICGKGYFRSASWPGYVCFQQWLELALGAGQSFDGEALGPQTPDAATFDSFDELWEAFVEQMAAGVRASVIEANRGEIIKRQMTPRPLMSALTDGCIESGLDFTEGGARYNHSGFQAFGLGTCADSLAAIRQFVYEDGELSLAELVDILKSDWEGHERLRVRMQKETPHWGNDDPEVDELAVRIVKTLETEVDRYTNIRGGPFCLGLWSFWQHLHFGQRLGASADGRHAGEMLSHSMGPSVGQAMEGPTAAVKSAGKIDTSGLANGGSLLLEFDSTLIDSPEGGLAVIDLVRTYFDMGGIQMQLSTVSPEVLEDAIQHPEEHQDLVVRVAGYCDYFVNQAPERQAFILRREKHGTAH